MDRFRCHRCRGKSCSCASNDEDSRDSIASPRVTSTTSSPGSSTTASSGRSRERQRRSPRRAAFDGRRRASRRVNSSDRRRQPRRQSRSRSRSPLAPRRHDHDRQDHRRRQEDHQDAGRRDERRRSRSPHHWRSRSPSRDGRDHRDDPSRDHRDGPSRDHRDDGPSRSRDTCDTRGATSRTRSGNSGNGSRSWRRSPSPPHHLSVGYHRLSALERLGAPYPQMPRTPAAAGRRGREPRSRDEDEELLLMHREMHMRNRQERDRATADGYGVQQCHFRGADEELRQPRVRPIQMARLQLLQMQLADQAREEDDDLEADRVEDRHMEVVEEELQVVEQEERTAGLTLASRCPRGDWHGQDQHDDSEEDEDVEESQMAQMGGRTSMLNQNTIHCSLHNDQYVAPQATAGSREAPVRFRVTIGRKFGNIGQKQSATVKRKKKKPAKNETCRDVIQIPIQVPIEPLDEDETSCDVQLEQYETCTSPAAQIQSVIKKMSPAAVQVQSVVERGSQTSLPVRIKSVIERATRAPPPALQTQPVPERSPAALTEEDPDTLDFHAGPSPIESSSPGAQIQAFAERCTQSVIERAYEAAQILPRDAASPAGQIQRIQPYDVAFPAGQIQPFEKVLPADLIQPFDVAFSAAHEMKPFDVAFPRHAPEFYPFERQQIPVSQSQPSERSVHAAQMQPFVERAIPTLMSATPAFGPQWAPWRQGPARTLLGRGPGPAHKPLRAATRTLLTPTHDDAPYPPATHPTQAPPLYRDHKHKRLRPHKHIRVARSARSAAARSAATSAAAAASAASVAVTNAAAMVRSEMDAGAAAVKEQLRRNLEQAAIAMGLTQGSGPV